MKRFWVILMGIIAWGFLMIPSISFAHTHTLDTDVHAESPFDAPKDKKSPHCKLLGHHHSALLFCPHTKQVRSMETQFKADCGDSQNSTLIQFQGSKTLMLCPSIEKNSSLVNRSFVPAERFLLPSPYSDQLEKPPQHA